MKKYLCMALLLGAFLSSNSFAGGSSYSSEAVFKLSLSLVNMPTSIKAGQIVKAAVKVVNVDTRLIDGLEYNLRIIAQGGLNIRQTSQGSCFLMALEPGSSSLCEIEVFSTSNLNMNRSYTIHLAHYYAVASAEPLHGTIDLLSNPILSNIKGPQNIFYNLITDKAGKSTMSLKWDAVPGAVKYVLCFHSMSAEGVNTPYYDAKSTYDPRLECLFETRNYVSNSVLYELPVTSTSSISVNANMLISSDVVVRIIPIMADGTVSQASQVYFTANSSRKFIALKSLGF